MYTATSLFLQALRKLAITHLFVNWGSDHPAFLEELERQRAEDGEAHFLVVTCPNEMVALSAAQGYAQVLGRPAAVIVHVDVGTQALAGAVHNVDRSRTPVIIFAGASPTSSEREHAGSVPGARNEWIMWVQGQHNELLSLNLHSRKGSDIPDQAAIVRQYMRHTAQIGSLQTTENMVNRAFQISMSAPKGPVYLWGRRDIMELPVDEATWKAAVAKAPAVPVAVSPAALSPSDLSRIAGALLAADSPLIVTSFLGRNVNAVAELIKLAELLAIPVVNACPSAVNIPFSHPSYAGTTYMFKGTHLPALDEADLILVIECEIPWIPVCDEPRNLGNGLQVFLLDSGDPLRVNVGYWNVPAAGIFRADAEIALKQINESVAPIAQGIISKVDARRLTLRTKHERLVADIEATEALPPPLNIDGIPTASFTVPNLMRSLRLAIEKVTPSRGSKTLYLNESISNFPLVWNHLRTEVPGQMLTLGGSSLGWGLGASVGSFLASKESKLKHDLSVLIVGDGAFLFGVPSSAYWMARRYETPFLTIVLNNGGWRSPKFSMLGVHPTGYGSHASGDRLSVGFGPDSPDYSQIAVAASSGWALGERIGGPKWDLEVGLENRMTALQTAIESAIKRVFDEKRCVVLDCILESI
ncbi:hypothetical protein CVT24_012894 [Panaeolus cyanescens]|uniref:Thiamine pyrophosphate enzyme TPP-binding domain-containing protein n=1 Tax=Panaeolus cyanescens TaxID=181874 RepID=A0A409W2X8_9AGAR|nr:hypothetical protein CVT24_012894 [Panaeolus cyanescens]